MKMEITKEEFERYVKVQRSGRTNMFDVRMVEALSGLPREKIFDIMKNYNQLFIKYGEKLRKVL
jgi:predicted ATPase